MNLPAWHLLLWSGAAATALAATVGALLGGRIAPWSLAPRARSRSDALGVTLVGGLVVLPLLYGFLFELLHSASLFTGLVLGLVHAAAALLIAGPREHTRAAICSALVSLVYGVALGLLYISS